MNYKRLSDNPPLEQELRLRLLVAALVDRRLDRRLHGVAVRLRDLGLGRLHHALHRGELRHAHRHHLRVQGRREDHQDRRVQPAVPAPDRSQRHRLFLRALQRDRRRRRVHSLDRPSAPELHRGTDPKPIQ